MTLSTGKRDFRNPAVLAAFAMVLRESRIASGLTQVELARESGISYTNIQYYETGQRQPKLSALFALAAALGQSPVALLSETKKHIEHAGSVRRP